MDLNTLELFVAVAQTASFSAAARRLNLPKSTVSRGVARLEQALGVTLINRTTRQVSLSSAGAALLERVGAQLEGLKKSLGELPETDEQPSGHLRLSAGVDFGSTVLPELVTLFLARCPSVTVDVNVSNRVVDLVAERFDLTFRATGKRLASSSLVAHKAGGLAMQVYGSPTYLARKGTPKSPRDLSTHEWIAFRSGASTQLHGPTENVTVHLSPRLVADDMFFLREAVRAGAGLALIPSYLAERDLTNGQLVRVLPRWDVRTGAMWLVTPGGRLPKKTQAFRSFALDYLRAHPLTTHAD